MSHIIEKADSILKNYEIPDRSTYFQLKNFVLGTEPNSHAQAVSCIRNIQDRRDQIDDLYSQIEESEDDILLINIQIERIKKENSLNVSDWEKEKEIQIRKLERKRKSIEKNNFKLIKKVKYILEEIQYLNIAYDKLIEFIGELKPLDDEVVQNDYWNQKLTEEVNLSFMLNKPISTELVRTILSLDDNMDVKKQVVAVLHNAQKKMLENKNKESNG